MHAADLDFLFAERSHKDGLNVIIASGSVAAANLGGLVAQLDALDAGPVVVILTKAARQFVSPLTIRHLGGCPVLQEETCAPAFREPLHVWLTDVARRVLVYPASAGFLGRVAAGLATDLASTTLLCATGIPSLVVPSMHSRMWSNCLVQQNIKRLIHAGISVLDPAGGMAPPVDDVIATFLKLDPGVHATKEREKK